MSWQATAWVSRVEAGGASGKLLLYALANYADENGRCWPSDARLMADTEMAERTIREWKRKLEDAGLLVVERRRGAAGTFQADEIRLVMSAKTPKEPPADAAGGEPATTGISPQHHRHLTAQPPASDRNPPTPPYKAEPSIEPPIEPIEREARERDPEGLTKRAESLFYKSFKIWDRFDPSPKQPMLAAWAKLTWEDMEASAEAVGRYLAGCRSAGMKHAPAISKYLDPSERLWDAYPPVEQSTPTIVDGKPLGPWWMADRLRQLIVGPTMRPAGLTSFDRKMVADGKANEAELMRQKLAKMGWPAINAMHDRAANRQGVSVSVTLKHLADMMEPVPVGSERYVEWQVEHELRGWPWLPDPGDQRVVYFPAGGPGALDAFEQAMRGNQNDAGQREAAE